MKMLANGLLLSLLGLFASGAFAAEVSEAAVKKLMAEVDKAIPVRNVAAIEKLLAEHVAIAVTVNVGDTVQRIDMTKPEYIAMLREAWSVASGYTYRRSNQKIRIQGHQAIVTADVTESILAEGRTVVTQSHETAIVEDVAGTLQATVIRVVSLAEPGMSPGVSL